MSDGMLPCQRRIHGLICTDRDNWPGREGQHLDDCAMSLVMSGRRDARIRSLTFEQLRRLAVFMGGYAPRGVDIALDDADALRCAECREDTPWHTAQCTLRPGAEPVAVPVPIAEVAR